eukprot:15471007-Alexandrium_andersonii.AAC.1
MCSGAEQGRCICRTFWDNSAEECGALASIRVSTETEGTRRRLVLPLRGGLAQRLELSSGRRGYKGA